MEDISKTIKRQNAEAFLESQLKYFKEVEHLCFPGAKIPVPEDEYGRPRALVTTDENDLKEVYRVPKECYKIETGAFVLKYEDTKKDGTEVRIMQVVNGEIDYKKFRDEYYNHRKNEASDCHVRGAVAVLRTERKPDEEFFKPTRVEYSYYDPEMYDYVHKEKYQNDVLIGLNKGQGIENADFEKLIESAISKRWVENKQFPMSEVRRLQIFDEFVTLEGMGGIIHKQTRDEIMQKYIAEIERLTAENNALKEENSELSKQNDEYKQEIESSNKKNEEYAQNIESEREKINQIRSEVSSKLANAQAKISDANAESDRLRGVIADFKKYIITVPVMGKQFLSNLNKIEISSVRNKENKKSVNSTNSGKNVDDEIK